MAALMVVFAITAIIATTTSCEKSHGEAPNFRMAEDVYAGQTQQLQKLGLCKFDFSAEEYADCVSIAPENEDGEVFASFWFNTSTEECKPVVITARNAEDAKVDPVKVTTTIHPWKLYVLKKNKYGQYGIANPSDPERVFEATAGDYCIQMYALEKNNHSWVYVESFIHSFNPEKNGALTWTTDNRIPEGYTQRETGLEFHLTGNENEIIVVASLGEGTRKYSRRCRITLAN